MIIGITGHRKFETYDNIGIQNKVFSEIEKVFSELKPKSIISGFAIGTDQIAVEAAIKLSIPFIAAVPFSGQELFWPTETQEHYRDLISKAEQVVVVSRGGFASWKMHARNKYIVDNSDIMIAVISPKTKSGGTFNCVEYAKNQNKKIHYINPYD